MLTERQQEIVNNWGSEHEGNKKEVRRKFKEALEILPLLCELPPHEARKIVDDAIDGAGEIDDWSREKETPPGMPNSRRVFYAEYLVECVIAILFNGVVEHLFQSGLEDGLKRGERWWMGQDLPGHDPISQFVRSLPSLSSENGSEPVISNKVWEPPVTPENKEEKLVWILDLDDNFDEISELHIYFILQCDIFENSLREIREDKNKPENKIFSEEYKELFPDDIASYDTLIQARKAIESSRKTAEEVAAVINNSRNTLPFSFSNTALSRREERFVDRVKRFYIELHRGYLDEKNLLPDDDQLPEASDLIIGAPSRSKLDLEEIST